jgi:hypothetical protein
MNKLNAIFSQTWILSLCLILFSTATYAQKSEAGAEDQSSEVIYLQIVKEVDGERTIIDTMLRNTNPKGNWHMGVDREELLEEELIGQLEELVQEIEVEIEVLEGQEKKMVRKVMVRTVDEDGNVEEREGTMVIMTRIDRTTYKQDDDPNPSSVEPSKRELKINDLKFSPNPNDGRFSLSFNLPKRADTEISIFDVSGRAIYQEVLSDYKGDYKEVIDISENAKGVYFLKISQGAFNSVNKILIK